MPGTHSRRLFATALAISLALHVCVLTLVPLKSHGSRTGLAEEVFAVYLEPPEPERERIEEQPQPPPPSEPMLGLNAPLPRSLTWLGFTDFMPQFAQPAEVEQAAFTDEQVAAAPQPTPSDAPTHQRPVEQSPPTEPPRTEVAQQNPINQDNEPQQVVAARHPEVVESSSSESSDPSESGKAATAALLELLKSLQLAALQTNDSLPAGRKQDTLDENHHADQGASKQPDAGEPATPDQSVAANKPVAPHSREGIADLGAESDKQSQPTSIIEVPRDHWQMGKPLAGQGLELKPRRPTFTLLTMLTAAPGNPLCEMSFDQSGVVTKARIVERSGDSRIDEAILNSLYYWRAAGTELEKLKPGETLEVQIRIMLSRRRA